MNLLLWRGKKPVRSINTFHNHEEQLLKITYIKCYEKSGMFNVYDQNMGGVDKCDRISKDCVNERKNRRWTNSLVFYPINMLLHNSYFLYKEFSSETSKFIKQLTFKKEIIKYPACLTELVQIIVKIQKLILKSLKDFGQEKYFHQKKGKLLFVSFKRHYRNNQSILSML